MVAGGTDLNMIINIEAIELHLSFEYSKLNCSLNIGHLSWQDSIISESCQHTNTIVIVV